MSTSIAEIEIEAEAGPRLVALPFAAAIASGAFLLFLVQPLVGKALLPLFGGGSSVWTTCLLFFQSILLAGYLYAHLLSSRLVLGRQVLVHSILLAVSIPLLSVLPEPGWRPADIELPTWRILAFLGRHVGLPLLLVGATGPLIQRWFTHRLPGRSPYRLYALSNAASLAGLAAYPFLLEPLIGLEWQAVLWSVGYVAFAASSVVCGVLVHRRASAVREAPMAVEEASLPAARRLLWLALAAGGTLLLMATTNQITQDIAPIPLLWVVPLGLYLASLIVCFDHPRWYDRRVWVPLLALGLVASVAALWKGNDLDMLSQLAIATGTMFCGCMVCHGELARSKPGPRRLTSYYLTVAAGGALGGLFVALAAPLLFHDYWEYQLGLFAVPVLLALCLAQERRPGVRIPRPAVGVLIGGLLLGAALFAQVRVWDERPLAASRNFYGALAVYDRGEGTHRWRRELWHGRLVHGEQFLDPRFHNVPISYYGPDSGIAVATRFHPRRVEGPAGLSIGVVGLGTGSIAVHARPGDRLRFYEINPEIERIARSEFSYLEDSAAPSEVVLGDARLVLERELRERGQEFDILVLDAFNSDAVPVHLMTKEAFATYFGHLRADGILAVHISAIHIDLKPVVVGLAQAFDKCVVRVREAQDSERNVRWNEWLLVTDAESFCSDPRVTAASRDWRRKTPVVWTDDHSNLLQVLRR